VALEQPQVSGTDQEQKVDLAAAYVTLRNKDSDDSLGTYLLALAVSQTEDYPSQKVTVDGKAYEVALRPRRTYKRYTIHLQKFNFGVFPGTETPRDFSSYVRLVDPDNHVDRETRIWMNHPLDYRGETFYQSQALGGGQGTVLQVVKNPGSILPYLACIMVASGMLIHFGWKLTEFLARTLPGKTATRTVGSNGPLYWLVPAGVLSGGSFFLLVGMLGAHHSNESFHFQDIAQIPVQDGGRIKPLDTVARINLLIINNKQTYKDEGGRTQPAVRWLLDLMTSGLSEESATRAAKNKVFRIDHPDLLKQLGLEGRSGYRYALEEFEDKLPDLQKDMVRIQKQKKSNTPLDKYDEKLLDLARHVSIHFDLARLPLRMVPPLPGGKSEDWNSVIAAIKAGMAAHQDNPTARSIGKILYAYAKDNPKEFNDELADYQRLIGLDFPTESRMTRLETFFNNFDPFFWCLVGYASAFLLSCLSWLVWREPLRRMGFWMLVLAFAVHTAAILTRMWLQGRPPVTNLYGSAVFIAWGCVVLGLVLEYIFRLGIGTAVAAALAFGVTFIQDGLAPASGDTMEMMQAVLDTNFWLATHVTCVTIGYTATLLAGVIGMVYLGIRGVARLVDRRQTTLQIQIDNGPKVDLFRVVSQMMYGIICFAMLFSFTGTVLGGIWADYSWGRFWGWDPKENGALLIVIWNALILHARWGGLVKSTGVARLTVLGNNITFWSWFGTNQLRIGLHSYGFNEHLVALCRWFWVAECVFLAFEALTLINWPRLFSKPQTKAA
jgi:ABC-type transport system involved in cytochrome c biogenesis permease subunit